MPDLEKTVSLKADYMDLRVISSSALRITAKDGRIEETESGLEFGFGVRALFRGSWGFATTNRGSRLMETAKHAVKLARVSHLKTKKRRIRLAESEAVEDEVVLNPYTPSVDEVRRLVLECESEARIKSVKSTTSSVANTEIEKLFLNSEGARVKQKYFRSFLSVNAVAKKGDILQEANERSTSFQWDHKSDVGRKAADTAVRLLSGRKPPSGRMKIIMDPTLVGVFLHEALGHMAEADLVLEGQSIIKDKLGAKIGSDLVTIIDDGTINGYGKIFYDDEGVKAAKTTLVENGILQSFLHDRKTAGELNAKPTGNGRAQSYSSMPVVRMTNTYIAAGDLSFEELLEELKDGIYLVGSKGGQASPARGVFQFACKEGYFVEDSELKYDLRDVSISGNTLHVLKSVSAVGNDFKIDSPGHCGKKGQSVPVDGGGPHIIVEAVASGGGV